MEAGIQAPRKATPHGNSHPCELDLGITTGMTQSLDYAITYATINNNAIESSFHYAEKIPSSQRSTGSSFSA